MSYFNNLTIFFLGLAVSAISGAGVGIGTVFGVLINAVSRNPGLTNRLFSYAILGFAFDQAIHLLNTLFLIYVGGEHSVNLFFFGFFFKKSTVKISNFLSLLADFILTVFYFTLFSAVILHNYANFKINDLILSLNECNLLNLTYCLFILGAIYLIVLLYLFFFLFQEISDYPIFNNAELSVEESRKVFNSMQAKLNLLHNSYAIITKAYLLLVFICFLLDIDVFLEYFSVYYLKYHTVINVFDFFNGNISCASPNNSLNTFSYTSLHILII
jgi:F0F1-type ATP synthase membrane subunit c/vacuolar-type H+-ATPase subunit K